MKISVNRISIFILSLFIPQFAGLIGSIVTFPAIDTWYKTLNMPPIAPPNWVFGPVWTILYVLMGVSLFLVIKDGKSKKVEEATTYYFAQIIVNVLWSFAFFGLKSPLLGFLTILLLAFLIIMTIRKFASISKVSSYFLYPYIAWVSFATILNFWIYLLNS